LFFLKERSLLEGFFEDDDNLGAFLSVEVDFLSFLSLEESDLSFFLLNNDILQADVVDCFGCEINKLFPTEELFSLRNVRSKENERSCHLMTVQRSAKIFTERDTKFCDGFILDKFR
jgi:hypothetical protein